MTRTVGTICFTLTAVSLLSAASAVDDAGESDVRVMSFNIRYGSAKDGENIWDNRRELVVKTIREFDPDLLGTQETLPFQAEYINEELPEYTHVGWSREPNADGEHCMLFYRTSRFEQLDAGQYWLSEKPDDEFSKSWDSSLPRVATWVRLKDTTTDQEFLFVNTHFDHKGSEARLNSAKLIHERTFADNSELPVIVTGDFNCPENSSPWKALTGSGRLRDTWRVLNADSNEMAGTFHGFGGSAGPSRIDWVLVTPHFTVREASIDRSKENGRYPSDHFPVTAILRGSTGE